MQRSATVTKKLYSNPTELPPKEQFQRSNSNAARVAKMFGYAAPASGLSEGISEQASESAQAVSKVEEKPRFTPRARKPPNMSVALDSLETLLALEQQPMPEDPIVRPLEKPVPPWEKPVAQIQIVQEKPTTARPTVQEKQAVPISVIQEKPVAPKLVDQANPTVPKPAAQGMAKSLIV